LCQFLDEYNSSRSHWFHDIRCRGRHQHGGHIWYGGHIFDNGTLEEFDEDCCFPCDDLFQQSQHSPDDACFTYNFNDIDQVTNQLDIPWDYSKDQPFRPSTTYIGFSWDLSTLTVSFGTPKKEKYIRVIIDWKSRSSHIFNDIEKLYGKLLHACSVIPAGRAFLTSLETMLATSHHSPFLSQSAGKQVASDLEWWLFILRQPSLARPIPAPVELVDIGTFSDASSGTGIAIVVGGRWRAWRLIPGWQTLHSQRDISWVEALGFECLVCYLGTSTTSRHFIIYGNNKGVVEGWWNGRS
jgi:hypothetical protein